MVKDKIKKPVDKSDDSDTAQMFFRCTKKLYKDFGKACLDYEKGKGEVLVELMQRFVKEQKRK